MSRSTLPIEGFPALPRDDEGPVFKEPWEAHAFALAVRLSEEGWFTWHEWSEFLSQEIGSASERADTDYYQNWLAALERLCIKKGLVNGPEMLRRTEQWRRAYLNTPHGQPVELSAGGRSDK
jgi:nitrile hydratase accessory protein